jgi:Alginate lyase
MKWLDVNHARLSYAFVVLVGATIFFPRILAAEIPALLILDAQNLAEAKSRLQGNDAALAAPLARLKRDADRALVAAPFSVTQKKLLPPSGNKRDYMSSAPYWWPNPNTPNGLPYVLRDGEVNPEREQFSDRSRLENMMRTVKTLALAYFFTGREAYAERASRLLRTWFLDETTGMNPHLKYAQAVPGRSDGRGSGIIETHDLPELIDAVSLLNGSKSWTESDRKQLQKWFDAYLTWLMGSPEGNAEAKAQNNHGTWYDVQIAAFAIFTGRDGLAKKVLGEFSAKRIAVQIERDGRQPRELQRTRAWSYSLFNLEALFNAASIADKLGIDLWNYHTTDGRSIRRALDWLVPFASGEKKWSYKQISAFEPTQLTPLLRRAENQYRDLAYEQAIVKLENTNEERWRLLYPKFRELK